MKFLQAKRLIRFTYHCKSPLLMKNNMYYKELDVTLNVKLNIWQAGFINKVKKEPQATTKRTYKSQIITQDKWWSPHLNS